MISVKKMPCHPVCQNTAEFNPSIYLFFWFFFWGGGGENKNSEKRRKTYRRIGAVSSSSLYLVQFSQLNRRMSFASFRRAKASAKRRNTGKNSTCSTSLIKRGIVMTLKQRQFFGRFDNFCCRFFLELRSKRLYPSSEQEKENRCLAFTFFTRNDGKEVYQKVRWTYKYRVLWKHELLPTIHFTLF